jgi:hypothetical protein
MFPKFRIEAGMVNINGETIEEMPIYCGVQWKEEKDQSITAKRGYYYRFKVNVNGEVGNLTISELVLKKLQEADFQEILLSELDMNTNLTEFRDALFETYRSLI